ncbi:class I SAM-dependent methyltransferase [Tahibacter amnicola]|uniref:SAM-dependent methyltransferase n=1 Tax=Tahibacter amnicola TaxID=2976241 RepID=A0ABY6BFD5_9GAMM|nr:SAM-dependent methyltransferase [Tahibacter amnicola]UXI68227.1 SAM-dependent methyltransferase [Tahibacter amnicola]
MRTELPEPSVAERDHSATLAAFIRNEIAANGPMPFSRFMEMALYAPGLGYYSAGKTKFGRDGDFITAPELGSVFARCVARAMAPVLGTGENADVIELGGGSGAFAQDCLEELARLQRLPARYRILEPSADLRERQQRRLRAALPAALAARVEWIERPPEEDWEGVLFANEVIDALPTTRFCVRDGEVFEEHVVDDGNGGFASIDLPADSFVANAVRHVERDLGHGFADGYRSEVLPQLPFWIQAVCGSLARGMAMFVDYGYARREYYRDDRRDGTLIATYRHRAHDDPYRLVGLQDLTAFVDFSALAEAGVTAGMRIAGMGTQADFLIANGLSEVFSDLGMTADEVQRYRLSQEIKRLTLPAEMGEKFKVMAFERSGAD